MGLQFGIYLALVLGSIASAVSQQLPSFAFFSTEDTDFNTSPLYLVTKNTLKEVSFDAPEICSSGAWLACYNADTCVTQFFKENSCYRAHANFFTSAILFGNPSNMSQTSVTFFTGEYFKGDMSETYFENVPDFSGHVVSLILTGVQSATKVCLFTQKNYLGDGYVVNFDSGVGDAETVATSVVNLHNVTHLPADAFKSFKLGPKCWDWGNRITTFF